MTPAKLAHFFMLILSVSSAGMPRAVLAAKSNHLQEIKISLFGQSCTMSGPFQQAVLKSIHSISPEQMPPVQSKEQARQLLSRLKNAGSTPSELMSYRDKMIKRLEGLSAFFDALAQAKKDQSIEPLTALNTKWVISESKKEYESALKSSSTRENAQQWNDATSDQAREIFERFSVPDPQEEFHRSIQKIRVSYACFYEETDSEDAH